MRERVGGLLPPADAVVVELGSRTGIWAAQLIDAHAEKIRAVFCVDTFPAPGSNLAYWVATLGVYAYVKAFPLVGLTLWWAKFFPLPIDLLYVDADHDGDAPLLDARAWAPKVRPGGAVLFHDVDRHGPRKVARETFGEGRSVVEDLGYKGALTAWSIKTEDGSWRSP